MSVVKAVGRLWVKAGACEFHVQPNVDGSHSSKCCNYRMWPDVQTMRLSEWKVRARDALRNRLNMLTTAELTAIHAAVDLGVGKVPNSDEDEVPR